MVIRSSSARDVDQLLLDLQAGNAVRREAALARLRVLGSRAIARLEALLRHGDADLRVTVFRALDGIDDPRVVQIALRALDDPSIDVRLHAITALRPWVAHETGTRIMEALVSCVLNAQQSAAVRGAARDALSQLPRDIIQPVLEQAPPDAPDDGPLEPPAVEPWLAQHPQVPLSSLHGLITRLATGERAAEGEAARLPWRVARGAVHAALAKRESAVALYDLRETFDAATAPLPLDYLSAITALGDTTCLDALGKAWTATPRSEVWWRERLADAAAAIVSRLKLTGRHAAVKRVHAKWPGFMR